MSERGFRFGVNLVAVEDGARWSAKARLAEELGYDVLLVPDHLGAPSPFPALVAAAAVTSRPRVGTFVLNAAFWNPALLAREVATTDALVGGRLELGLGAGYVRAEFDDAGLPYGTGGAPLRDLEALVVDVRARLADPGHRPAPSQHPVPLLLGGHGERMLRLAAREADVVGFTGALADRDGNLRLDTPDAVTARIAAAREASEARAPELNVLVQSIEITDDPAEVDRLHTQWAPQLDRDEFLALPTFAVGRVEDIAAKYRALRREHGVSYLTVLEPSMKAFAEVMPLLR